MQISELRKLIEHLDPETSVEFHDAGLKRVCAIASATLVPAGESPGGHPILVLSKEGASTHAS